MCPCFEGSPCNLIYKYRRRPEYVLTEALGIALRKNFGEELQKVASRQFPIGTLGPEIVEFGFVCWLSDLKILLPG